MSTEAATAPTPASGLLAAFIEHNDLLGGQPEYRRQRLAAARSFLADHPNLDVWMAAPVDARLVELNRRQFAWQLVSFAVVSGVVRADAEFLFAKNFGHSMARWIDGLFPGDVDRLREAADRLGFTNPEVVVREVLSLAVAFCGRPPSSLTVDVLDVLVAAIDTTPRLTEAMRRRRRTHVFRLRCLLFGAGTVDLPAEHRRQGGPATRQARLAAVAAAEIRRTLLSYLDVRATVLRPKTIDKLTSALAIFGEFICDRDPELRSIAGLRRSHIEAFLAWTATRTGRGSHDNTRQVGPYVHAHAAITVRAFLDDIAAWGWADRPRQRLTFDTDIPRCHFIPDRIEWLHSEMIKSRIAHGYCSRHLAAGPCPCANICEQCENFVPDRQRRTVIAEQLADVIPSEATPPNGTGPATRNPTSASQTRSPA